jgi:6-phosphogluconolactonase (cycloisomerase 2 family)
VPRNSNEFLFLGNAADPVITGFRVNPDGLLSPIAGSPFAISAPAQSLQSSNNILIVKTESGNASFIVDQQTGALQPAGRNLSFAAAARLPRAAQTGSSSAVLDASGRFMYVIDSNRAELHGYSVNAGKLSELAVPYPVPRSTSGIAVVKP